MCAPVCPYNVYVCVSVNTHPGAVVAHSAAPGQTGVEIGDAVRAADWSVLMDSAATVHIATACQVPVGHRQGRPTQTDREKVGEVERLITSRHQNMLSQNKL